jgi:hypothetical protein
MGAGSMMGQTDMGTMTWQLTQNGSTVTGPMSFSGSGMQDGCLDPSWERCPATT